MINYEQFSQTELQVAEVKTAERVTGSDKLLKLMISLGEEERQIIAGIGKAYEPESLIGKQIIIVANLEPRQLMGLESQGMLLAADSEAGPVLLMPDKPVSPGSKIK
ncbi:MAG: methionine--tRNA ligase subunit beta [Candidatus Yanofskybacteria bacterium RIFCSPLOWO2_02_FULL_45_10]|uniref:Methionine--tRNA ligase n=3 Tax=Patescibacteria group TaxID=1783273 RepID=A0A1F8G387_9BACT|nr:MAG: Methionyl-tRNA synthetase, beta subunit [Candidatus Daviesbacteria bacterium GW2011_GWB1_41_5]OGN19520.1 MAG: methionine--tRNA ligase subunit beta [Candidatus Yanofskybacteria bacterium RIFCSPHIGHO2_12_FULL_45_19b]OGN32236.1 MAG: methionine--tRNA ligase subunit beta [Candidatus Yanofskybacteria bacterium RIFCSPLOWO2_02_FULL_45_10]